MKPFTELEWKKQLYTLRYILLQLEFFKNDLEYLRYLVPYIEQFAERYAEKATAKGKYKTKKEAYADYPLFKLTGVYALTMRAGVQYFEEGLEQVKINADYQKIDAGVTTIGQRTGKWELNEQGFMTEKELSEFYDRPDSIKQGMDSNIFDITIGGGWANDSGLIDLRAGAEGGLSGYFDTYPDNLLDLPYKDISIATGKPCLHRGEWITLGRDQEIKFIEEGALLPQSKGKEVIWELKTPWSTVAHKPSKYPLGYKVKTDNDDNPPESPVSGIWKAVGHDDISLQFWNIGYPMYTLSKDIEKEGKVIVEDIAGEWELIYIV